MSVKCHCTITVIQINKKIQKKYNKIKKATKRELTTNHLRRRTVANGSKYAVSLLEFRNPFAYGTEHVKVLGVSYK